MTQYTKDLDSEKRNLENEKRDLEKTNEILLQSIQTKETITFQLFDDYEKELFELRKENQSLKDKIEQIEQITPEYEFIGKNVSNSNEVKMLFDMKSKSLMLNINGNGYMAIKNKNIKKIEIDPKFEDKIWIITEFDEGTNTYNFQFTKKKVEYIIQYYKKIKYKPSAIKLISEFEIFSDF